MKEKHIRAVSGLLFWGRQPAHRISRTGKPYPEAIVLYGYQKDKKAEHPEEFLKGFQGVCVTDGYQAYHSLEEKTEGLVIAGCWAHARRKYAEALKAIKGNKNWSKPATLVQDCSGFV